MPTLMDVCDDKLIRTNLLTSQTIFAIYVGVEKFLKNSRRNYRSDLFKDSLRQNLWIVLFDPFQSLEFINFI